MNKGALLWREAKTIIPGGNQLLSKRSEQFLPEYWPAYYTKAKGCAVWDLEGNKYYDFAQMGVGSCALGYADPDVNAAVIKAIRQGSMATLNCPEEVALAKELIRIHPWADMARFARTGGEACAVAIRIARAATGKDKIAFCGYHGWHDWYLSSNLSKTTNLDGQLLPGLLPVGVPRKLAGTTLPFNYGHIEELEKIIADNPNEVGVIIMEPVRNHCDVKFLKQVQIIAKNINAILIFDEITSGFRLNVGGSHLVFGITPDIAVLGKALGNGYPISAIIGKKKVMSKAAESFISSTFWTEKVGFVAALATLDKMLRCNVPDRLVYFGEKINAGWKKAAKEAGIEITIGGIKPLTHLSFNYPNSSAIQTYYTQEMLKKGYLLGAAVYTTYAYNDKVINSFIKDSRIVFKMIKKYIELNQIEKMLAGPVKSDRFKRLN